MNDYKIYVLYDEIAQDIIALFLSKNDTHACLLSKNDIQKNVKSVDFKITLYRVTQINDDGSFEFSKIIHEFDSESFNSQED